MPGVAGDGVPDESLAALAAPLVALALAAVASALAVLPAFCGAPESWVPDRDAASDTRARACAPIARLAAVFAAEPGVESTALLATITVATGVAALADALALVAAVPAVLSPDWSPLESLDFFPGVDGVVESVLCALVAAAAAAAWVAAALTLVFGCCAPLLGAWPFAGEFGSAAFGSLLLGDGLAVAVEPAAGCPEVEVVPPLPPLPFAGPAVDELSPFADAAPVVALPCCDVLVPLCAFAPDDAVLLPLVA